ncbi:MULTISPECIES: hypothetical protein [unclassified Mycolicibacterium]|nr:MULTISPECIES: hypothetical protein [unclassified Mycolicibacterium]
MNCIGPDARGIEIRGTATALPGGGRTDDGLKARDWAESPHTAD